MRKVLNNSVVLLVFMAMVATAPVGAQIIDDKMMPPVLIMPPPEETGETEADDIIEDDDIIAPLSIMEVPVLDIVDEDEEDERAVEAATSTNPVPPGATLIEGAGA